MRSLGLPMAVKFLARDVPGANYCLSRKGLVSCFTAKDLGTGEISHYALQQTSASNCRFGATTFPGIRPTLTAWHAATLDKRLLLYEGLMRYTSEQLNHNAPLSRSQADVLFGPLAADIASLVSRILASLENLNLLNHELSSICGPIMDELEVTLPESTDDSYALLRSPLLIEAIEHSLVRAFFGFANRLQIHGVHPVPEKSFGSPTTSSQLSQLENFYLYSQRVLAAFSRRSRYSISNTYLSRTEELLLHLSLRQAPLLWEIVTSRALSNRTHRGRLAILDSSQSPLKLCTEVLKLVVPSNLVENFEDTYDWALELGFPQAPKLLFTSNNFGRNDLFKAHTARHLSSATYVVGQHGNKYGTSTIRDIAPEISSSDFFLSWGWSGMEKVIPFGILKRRCSPFIRRKPKSLEIFMRQDFSGYLQADNGALWTRYIKGVVDLAEALDQRGVPTCIRLHNNTSVQQREQISSLVREMSHVKICHEVKSLKKLIRAGILPVFTYDSTGMLELAAEKQLFFAFLRDCMPEIRQDYLENYVQLEKVKLLGTDPASSAMMLESLMNANKASLRKAREGVRLFAQHVVHRRRWKVLALHHQLRKLLNLR